MPTYNISSGLPAYPPALTDKEAAQLVPIYAAINTLAQRLSEVSGNVQYSSVERGELDKLANLNLDKSHIITVKANVALTYGQLLTLTASGTDILASPADHSIPTSPAHAICNMPLGIGVLEYGTAIFMHGKCDGVSGGAFGAQYWLGLAGVMQTSPPTNSGYRLQPVAIGLGGNSVFLNIPHIGSILP